MSETTITTDPAGEAMLISEPASPDAAPQQGNSLTPADDAARGRMSRDDFNMLSPAEQSRFALDGGTLFDADAAAGEIDARGAAESLAARWGADAQLPLIYPDSIPTKWDRNRVNDVHGRINYATNELGRLREQLTAKVAAAAEFNEKRRNELVDEAKAAAVERGRKVLAEVLELEEQAAMQARLHDADSERLTATFHHDHDKAVALEMMWNARVTRATPPVLQQYAMQAVATGNLALANLVELETLNRNLKPGDRFKIAVLCRAVNPAGTAAQTNAYALREAVEIAARGRKLARDLAARTGDTRLASMVAHFELEAQSRR